MRATKRSAICCTGAARDESKEQESFYDDVEAFAANST